LTPIERTALQEKRGVCLTISLHNEPLREIFLSKCGCKPSIITRDRHNKVITISPETCREGGAAATIQHISLVPTAAHGASFFISRDSGKAFYYSRLPDRLFRRLQSSKHRDASDLIYVSAGPLGCYYAEFRSGECWWGVAVDDDDDPQDFDTLCREWDIARVVFGPCCAVEDNEGRKYRAVSWIVISQDGRAAWKNLPSRLHQTLEGRMASEAAPAEVSLGYGGSYFVRFLDGTVDYCLPAHIADVIEKSRLPVTAVYMHPDLPLDYILRHR